jgi:Bacterial capsule synthesis protein PGA_cap
MGSILTNTLLFLYELAHSCSGVVKNDNLLPREPVSLSDTELIDIRGVGDSGWSLTHDPIPIAAEFGKQLEKDAILYRGDLNFMNWESAIGNSCESFSKDNVPGSLYAFVSRIENLLQAYHAGFNLIGLSNNHSRDCSAQLEDGSETYDDGAAGINTGLGLLRKHRKNQWLWDGIHDAQATVKEQNFRIKGRQIVVAFASLYSGRVACPQSTCLSDAKKILAQFKTSRARIKILALHSQDSEAASQKIASDFINEADGDIVFGHGPHSWRPVTFIKKANGKTGIIFESLGNFIHPALLAQQNNFLGRVLMNADDLSIKEIQAISFSTEGRSIRIRKNEAPPANFSWSFKGEQAFYPVPNDQ